MFHSALLSHTCPVENLGNCLHFCKPGLAWEGKPPKLLSEPSSLFCLKHSLMKCILKKKKSLHPWIEWLSTIRNALANVKFLKIDEHSSPQIVKQEILAEWVGWWARSTGYIFSRVCLVRALNILFGNDLCICAWNQRVVTALLKFQPQLFSADVNHLLKATGTGCPELGAQSLDRLLWPPGKSEGRQSPLDFDVFWMRLIMFTSIEPNHFLWYS